jgi:hypothetical protein
MDFDSQRGDSPVAARDRRQPWLRRVIRFSQAALFFGRDQDQEKRASGLEWSRANACFCGAGAWPHIEPMGRRGGAAMMRYQATLAMDKISGTPKPVFWIRPLIPAIPMMFTSTMKEKNGGDDGYRGQLEKPVSSPANFVTSAGYIQVIHSSSHGSRLR